MRDIARFRQGVLAFCLVITPVLMLLSVALEPPFVEDYAARLGDLDEAGAAAWASNTLFIVTQVPMLVVFLGLAHLIRHHAPRLAVVTTVIGVLAAFGESVMGAANLAFLTVASDVENRELYAGAWEDLESSPVMVYAVFGFGGTVLTLVLLSIGLFRSRLVPRWVPALIWGYLVLEFFGSALTSLASYAAAVCLLAAFGALGKHVLSTPRSEWGVGADAHPGADALVRPA